MTALELAADLESVGVYTDAAEMLRRQHGAIVKLREALIGVRPHFEDIDCTVTRQAIQALKDTRDLK